MTSGNNYESFVKAALDKAHRIPVEGLYFNGRDVVIDGYQFVACRFDNCTFHVNSGDFEFLNCVIDEKTIIFYSDFVSRVIQLFNSRAEWVYEKIPAFAPTRNADGTISIKG